MHRHTFSLIVRRIPQLTRYERGCGAHLPPSLITHGQVAKRISVSGGRGLCALFIFRGARFVFLCTHTNTTHKLTQRPSINKNRRRRNARDSKPKHAARRTHKSHTCARVCSLHYYCNIYNTPHTTHTHVSCAQGEEALACVCVIFSVGFLAQILGRCLCPLFLLKAIFRRFYCVAMAPHQHRRNDAVSVCDVC